jgi:hypothetical protein
VLATTSTAALALISKESTQQSTINNSTGGIAMSNRKFTDEQEQEICRRYQDGKSATQLGAALGVGDSTIGRILKRNGIAMRSVQEALGGLAEEAEAEVCKRYQEGESTVQLGIAFGVAGITISKTLKRNGVAMRTLKEACGGLTAEAETEVCKRYQEGESTYQLGIAFGVASTSIGRILKRNGVTARTVKEVRGGLTTEAETEVCKRYQEGESTVQLGIAFGVADVTIGKILKRNGVTARTPVENGMSLTDEAKSEVYERYRKGESTGLIGAALGVHQSSICKILKRNGIAMRTHREASGGLTDEAETEVCKRYQEGESTVQLGIAFGVANSTIGKILKRNEIELRIGGGYGDSIQHALDGTGHHSRQRECELYLYELARYSSTHCKPGISFNSDLRADDEYGVEVLRLVFDSRAEAYILEQAVLDQSRGCADCPDDLWDWSGASEVRAMPAEDMGPVVLRLAEELEEMGVWSFAAAYVPMTAAQRMQCQQRAHGMEPVENRHQNG